MDFDVYRRFVFDSFAMLMSSIDRALTFVHDFYDPKPFIFVVMWFVWMLIKDHRKCWTKPDEQERILQLILIPSIHVITSFVALQANENYKILFLVLDSIKECSLGLGIGIYLSFLHTYLSVNTFALSVEQKRRMTEKIVIVNVFPVTLVQPQCFVLNPKSLKFQMFWTWQFFGIRLVCSFLMIILQLLDMYPIWLSWALYLILNVSVCLALYTVSAFYQAFKKDFDSWRLTLRIFCIKGIVFVCFCQGGLLRVFVAMGFIKSNNYWRQELQHHLVIIEMMCITGCQWVAYNNIPYFIDAYPRNPKYVEDLLSRSGLHAVSPPAPDLHPLGLIQPQLKDLS